MNVALIPVRGGSKSIPFKNIKPLCGKPLVYWTIKAACSCNYIDKVFVSTDSKIIKETVNGFKEGSESCLFSKMEVIDRSAQSASDTASTESVMLEFAEKYAFDNIVLIQATSPLLQSSDLDRGFITFQSEGTDSVLSVVLQKRFIWKTDEDGFSYPTNYDVFHRPRRQDFDGFFVENGAFYITSKNCFRKSRNRVSGSIKPVVMDEDSYFEIDEPSDWFVIEAIMKKRVTNASSKKTKIKMFLTDCDGCLTDGGMYYSENGDELKKFNTRDGMGFSFLKEKGIITGIITGESAELNRRRADKLKIDILKSGCKDKLGVIMDLSSQYGIPLEEICYIGDDINDIEAINAVGFGCCPADAIKRVRDSAVYVTSVNGGEGVIREVVDVILNSEEGVNDSTT